MLLGLLGCCCGLDLLLWGCCFFRVGLLLNFVGLGVVSFWLFCFWFIGRGFVSILLVIFPSRLFNTESSVYCTTVGFIVHFFSRLLSISNHMSIQVYFQ